MRPAPSESPLTSQAGEMLEPTVAVLVADVPEFTMLAVEETVPAKKPFAHLAVFEPKFRIASPFGTSGALKATCDEEKDMTPVPPVSITNVPPDLYIP